MSLRYRILFVLGALLAVLLVLLPLLFYRFGTEQFHAVEQRVTERSARHSLAVVNDELAAMDLLTQDWANWDDTYAFVEDLNPAYIRSNITDETFINLHLNLMLFVRTSGEVAFARAYDLEAGEEMPIPQGVYDALPVLTATLSPGTGRQGVLLLPEGVPLVTARPILTSRGEGPARGTLVFGRFLSDDSVAKISSHLSAPAAIYRWDRPEDWPADLRQVSASLSTRPLLARPLNEEQIAGYALLTDLYGNPALVLTVVEERAIYHQFRFALRLFMVNVALMGLLFAGVVVLLLDHLVLARLAVLAAEVRAIGARDNSGRAVTVRGRDELAGLAEVINDMLAAIEQTVGSERSRKRAFLAWRRTRPTRYTAWPSPHPGWNTSPLLLPASWDILRRTSTLTPACCSGWSIRMTGHCCGPPCGPNCRRKSPSSSAGSTGKGRRSGRSIAIPSSVI